MFTASRHTTDRFSGSRYSTGLEPLERRWMLAGDPFQATITILVEGSEVDIPENIGIGVAGPVSEVRTEGTDGTVAIATLDGAMGPDGDITVGDFFDTWQNNAGLAGNNPDADFSSAEVLNNFTNEANTIRMWVNGIRIFDFENHVFAADEDILISYARDVRFTLNTNLDGPNGGAIPIELFPGVTPVTVANLLGYINRGDYDDVFFHRRAADFVVQGGGFETPSTDVDDPSFSVSPITTQPTIVNEPGLSNVKDTLAVAKMANDPNSGSSQFFWSRQDNSGNLDNQNGGFTVFGQVDSSGSEVFESINLLRTATDIVSANGISSFAELQSSPFFSDGFKSLFDSASGDAPMIEDGGSLNLVGFESFVGDGFALGTKFNDLDRDGIFDAHEEGIEGWTIFIDENDDGILNPGERSTLTDPNGDYAFRLPAGTHVIREVLEPGFVQSLPLSPVANRYEVTITEIGQEFVDRDFGNFSFPVPQAIDLIDSSDTGVSNVDDITRLNNGSANDRLTFSVSGVEPGLTVQVLADGVVIGEADATASTVTIITDGTSTLNDGVRAFAARHAFQGSVGLASPSLNVTIDSTSPVFDSSPPTQVAFPDDYSYDAETSDDASGVAYSLTTAPVGMTIDASTGLVSWSPTVDQDGDHPVTIVASDVAGNTAEQQFTVQVQAAPPVLDDITTQTVNEGELLSVPINFTDADLPNDTITVTLGPGAAAGAAVNGAFTWTPTEEQGPGDFSFTVRVTDAAGLFDETTFTVTVNEVNQPPIIDVDSEQTVEVGNTLAFGITASDPDVPAQALTYELVGDDRGALVDANGQFIWTPNAAQGDQIHPFTVSVSDGERSAQQSFNVVVFGENLAPEIDAIEPVQIDEGQQASFTANSTDPNGALDTQNFSLGPNAPDGATIDPISGTFSWIPAESQGPGEFTFDVIVADRLGLTDSTPVTITVNEVNQMPDLQPIEDRPVVAGSLLSFVPAVTDPDLPANSLIFSLEPGAPAGAAIDPNTGQFTFTPDEQLPDTTFSVSIRVEDAGGLSDVETFNILVSDLPEAPTVNGLDDQQLDENSTLTLIPTFSDPDLPADILTFSLDDAPAGATVDPQTGQISWTPSESQGPGMFNLTLRVTDSAGLFDTSTFSIVVNEVNEAPNFAVIGDQPVTAGSELSFTPAVIDPDLPANGLSFSLESGAPAGSAIDPVTGRFTLTPDANLPDTTLTATIRVEDADGLSDVATFNILVADVPQAPIISLPGNQQIDEGALFEFISSATDPDELAPTILFNLTDAPLGATIDPQTGAFNWTPSEEQGPGNFDITVEGTDSTGLVGRSTFSVEVAEVNSSPSFMEFDEQNAVQGVPFSIELDATDADLPVNALTYSLVGANFSGATIDPQTGIFQWIPGPNDVGENQFTVRVADTQQLVSTATLMVDVAVPIFSPDLFRVAEQAPSPRIVFFSPPPVSNNAPAERTTPVTTSTVRGPEVNSLIIPTFGDETGSGGTVGSANGQQSPNNETPGGSIDDNPILPLDGEIDLGDDDDAETEDLDVGSTDGDAEAVDQAMLELFTDGVFAE